MEEFNNPVNSGTSPLPEIIANSLRIEGLLGRGGMGTVYRATHLSLDRVVAVKIINPELVANTEIAQRFVREARLMAKLRHPRAAMIYDSGTLPDGRLFIVMEYVEGETLADVLKREGRLPYRRAVEIATSICEVLSEAHSLGIIHRDLKPANIMLNQKGIFVLDFGIAKMLGNDNAESLKLSMTGHGALVGTPFYMSPEQCLGQPVEARSDLYSLGALLYEMLAGRPPFDDEVLSAVIIKHAMMEHQSLKELNSDVPLPLVAVVNKLLAKKPEDRPADAEQARALLQASIADQPATGYTTQINPLSTTGVTQQINAVSEMGNTQQLNAQTRPLITNPETVDVQMMPRKSRFPIIGIAVLLLLVATLSGALIWMALRQNIPVAANSSANQVNNTASNYYSTKANQMSNMSSMGNMDHNMATGNDFSVKEAGDEKANSQSIPLISQEEADTVITKITQTTEHRADGMQIIKTPKDSAIVCIHNMIEMGKTHMFAVERPNANSAWAITARVSLDVPEFHGANWTFEPEDADGDGFDDVIFKGVNADNTVHRILIYVPRTRQNYSVLATIDASGKINNLTFSPNALVPNGAKFKTALEQAAKSQ